MILATLMDNIRLWFSTEYLSSTLGYILAIACGIFLLTELYTIITQKNEPDLAMLLIAGILGGLVQGFTTDVLLAILTTLCWVMIYSLWTIRESPVWRELMLASLISYIFVLVGRTVQVAMEMRIAARGYETDGITYVRWGLTGQQWFGISWNLFIYVFFILCIIFFGRRFFLVSRLTSPQIIYLLLFALSYVILYQFSTLENLQIYYNGVQTVLADRLLFASFGTYEIMICMNIFLYLISGPLLHLIFGVKKVESERVHKLVQEVKEKLGIKGKIRVGKVKAPILNAFAFGAFFDKRIAFMSKDINDFTDDDIRGIAGHELAHASRVHTLWLLLLTTATFAITKAINFPATAIDYIFNPDVGLDFLWYYLYNIAILAFSYIFVRFLEGRADKLTMEAGYGKPLAKSLVRLDGFYQGIASEMGLSVYLLTDKEQTKAEKIRFLGDSGRNMYNNYVKPNVMENFVNLIASHPKTAYRVVALTEQEKLRPFKAAMLPLLLSIPFVRRKFVKELQDIRKKVAPVIDETFTDSHKKSGIKSYDKLSHLSYQYEYLNGKDIVAISKTDKKDFFYGKVTSIKLTDTITSPITLDVKTDAESKTLDLSDYNIHEIAINQKQVFKNGKIGTIQELTSDEKFSFKTKFNDNGSEIVKDMKVPGIPITYFKNIIGKDVLLLQKGVTRLAKLDAIEFDENSIADSDFVLTIGSQTKTIKGSKFIIGFKPFDVYLKKGKEELQKPILKSLVGKPASFQTKDDLDTLVKGLVKDITDENVILEILDETKEIKINRIEFVYLYEDSMVLYYKPSISFIERIFMMLGNRKKLVHIIT